VSNWRVYQREWIVSYTSDLTSEEGQAEAMGVYEERWAGRIAPGDYRFSMVGAGATQILLFVPNLQGEFRTRADAEDLCPRDVTPVIVPSGSPEERALLDYGKRMLPREPAR
jgi:hypothetical protein